MTRVLALLLAVGMVVGAFQIRAIRTGTGEDGGPSRFTSRGPLTVLCDAELEAVCQELRAQGQTVTAEPAGTSFDRLASAPDAAGGPDLWVTLAPWPAMVDEDRARRGLQPMFAGESVHVAASPLVIVTWQDRGDALEAGACAGPVTWTCMAGTSGTAWSAIGGQGAWGNVKPGSSNPATSSVGLAVLAAATAQELGTASFGSRTLSGGPYLDWLSTLVTGVPDFDPSIGSPFAAMVSFGPSTFDLVGTTEAAARAVLDANVQRAGQLRLVYPSATHVDAIVAGRADVPEAVATTVADALADAGWHTEGQRPEPAAPADPTGPADAAASAAPPPPPVPGEAGASLPGAGAMTALRITFAETARR